MKVLFIVSGNSNFCDIAPFIKSQGKSLEGEGIDLLYYKINRKGIIGYYKSAKDIKHFLKKGKVDIIHAHYTLSGWATVLSYTKLPIVLSLMGSDAYGEYIGENKIRFSSRYLTMLTYLIQPFVDFIICKSKHLEKYVYLKNKTEVIPNGIKLNETNYNNRGYKTELSLERDKQYVLFLGNKTNIRKNFKIFEEAAKFILDKNVSFIAPYPITHDMVIRYLYSVDVLVVPSFMEGSSNIIKEAMACNCPVVATKVGDVEWLFGDEPGHYISGFDSKDLVEKIKLALEFSSNIGRTNGRERLKKLGLDSESVAKNIIKIYEKIIAKPRSKTTN